MDLNQVGRYRPGHLSAVSSCATMHVHLLFAALNNLSPLYVWECPSNIPRNILLIGQFEKNILTRDLSLVTSPQKEKCPIGLMKKATMPLKGTMVSHGRGTWPQHKQILAYMHQQYLQQKEKNWKYSIEMCSLKKNQQKYSEQGGHWLLYPHLHATSVL